MWGFKLGIYRLVLPQKPARNLYHFGLPERKLGFYNLSPMRSRADIPSPPAIPPQMVNVAELGGQRTVVSLHCQVHVLLCIVC